MAEGLTFANYALSQNGIDEIYSIGAGEGNDTGVIPEIATAFGHELSDTPSVDNLGELIRRVGPAKELQENIGLVQEALGTAVDGIVIASDWANRSGLLTPVSRSYVTAEAMGREPLDVAVITGGVRNWMARRADRLIQLRGSIKIREALLIAGNRPMKPTEGPDVEEDMTEADYMRDVIMKRLTGLSMLTSVATIESGVGDEVMAGGAQKAIDYRVADFESGRVAVISNAGAWIQNAGQFRRAARAVISPDFDNNGDQLFVVSDSFPIGTGIEPTATHQNPLTAVGQIVRNAQELTRQGLQDLSL